MPEAETFQIWYFPHTLANTFCKHFMYVMDVHCYCIIKIVFWSGFQMPDVFGSCISKNRVFCIMIINGNGGNGKTRGVGVLVKFARLNVMWLIQEILESVLQLKKKYQYLVYSTLRIFKISVQYQYPVHLFFIKRSLISV